MPLRRSVLVLLFMLLGCNNLTDLDALTFTPQDAGQGADISQIEDVPAPPEDAAPAEDAAISMDVAPLEDAASPEDTALGEDAAPAEDAAASCPPSGSVCTPLGDRYCGQYSCNANEAECVELQQRRTGCELLHAMLNSESELVTGTESFANVSAQLFGTASGGDVSFVPAYIGDGLNAQNTARVELEGLELNTTPELTVDLWFKPQLGNNSFTEAVLLSTSSFSVSLVMPTEPPETYKLVFKHRLDDSTHQWQSPPLTWSESWHRITFGINHAVVDDRWNPAAIFTLWVNNALQPIVYSLEGALAVPANHPLQGLLTLGNSPDGLSSAHGILDDVKLYPFTFTPQP